MVCLGGCKGHECHIGPLGQVVTGEGPQAQVCCAWCDVAEVSLCCWVDQGAFCGSGVTLVNITMHLEGKWEVAGSPMCLEMRLNECRKCGKHKIRVEMRKNVRKCIRECVRTKLSPNA